MKLLLALLITLPSLASAQWRAVRVSSTTDMPAIQENFRRASLWSSKKLDKSGGTITGPLKSVSTITANYFVGDGSSLTGVPAPAGIAYIASTQTFSGDNTFSGSVTVSSFTALGDSAFSGATSTATFAGWVDMGFEVVENSGTGSDLTVSCSSGYKVISGGGSCGNFFMVDNTSLADRTGWYLKCSNATDKLVRIICARVK